MNFWPQVRGGGDGVTRRRFGRSTLGLLALTAVWPVSGLAGEAPVRIALTAAAVRDKLPFYDRWAAYLTKRLGRSVQFVQRRSYHDTLEMLRAGELDFAWVCAYSFLQAEDAGIADFVAAPVFHGEPYYRSLIIVSRDSPAETLADLQSKSFAFADPDSLSGYVVPRAMLRDSGHDPDHFFRLSFFTWDHGQAIEAVAEKVADGAAVDSYVWEYMAAMRPEIADRTKIIDRSGQFGFPPMVARRGIEPALRRKFTAALFAMTDDPEGRNLLQALMLDRFAAVPLSHYDSVREVLQRSLQAQLHVQSQNMPR